MSKPQFNEYLKVESKRHQSYHIDEQGFQSTTTNSFNHLPRSPLLTSDILEGFPIPPSNVTRRSSTLSPIPFRSSPSPSSMIKRSSSYQETYNSNSSLGNRPLLSLPTSQNLLSSSLSEVNSREEPVFPARRRSSIAEQEIPYHPSFSPTFSDTSSTNSSYFPPTSQPTTSYNRRPILEPLYFPPRTFDLPSSPSPPPQIALPIIPSFVSVFIDPSTKFSSSPTESSPPYRSPTSLSGGTGRSNNSTLEIVVPGNRNSSKGKSKEEVKLRDVHLSTLIGEETHSENPFDDRGIMVDQDDIDSKDGKKRRRKNASLVNKLSFGDSTSQAFGKDEGNFIQVESRGRKEDAVRSRNASKGFLATSSDDFMTKRTSSKGLLATIRRKLSNKPLILIVMAVLIAVVVATIVGIHISQLNSTQLGASTLGDCSCENGGQAGITSEGVCTCLCTDIWSGGYCQYNSTCVIPEGSIYPTAQGLLNVATSANSFFSPAINSSRLALVINTYLNLPVASQCRSQLAIISLPNLPPSHFNRRATWSSAALLWSIANTEVAATTLQSFITSKNYTQFGDFPSSTSDVNYQLEYYGYTFDFSTLQLSVAAASWITTSSPDASQSSIMSPNSMQSKALDTMYSHSIAASTQRNLSLIHYWNELKLNPADLRTFINAVKSAPVIVPFDATSTVAGLGIMDLANAQSSTSSFPPAPACIAAGLSRAQVGQINSVEVGFFGLEALSSSEIDNTTCVDRPIYGMINLLSLRLPFVDADTRSLPTQALVLQESTKSRMIVHAGELLVGVSSNSPAPSPSTPAFPDHFGTFSNLDSVILEYLQLLSPQVARDLVNFILSQSKSSPLPPTFPSSLYQNSNKLLDIPILEITLFGGLRYQDINHSISSLSSGSNLHSTAFFGTPTAQNFRNWALAGPKSIGSMNLQGPLLWARGALEITPVKESSLSNSAFEKVWNSSLGVSEDMVWNELSNLVVV